MQSALRYVVDFAVTSVVFFFDDEQQQQQKKKKEQLRPRLEKPACQYLCRTNRHAVAHCTLAMGRHRVLYSRE